jgi:hypothetical protein
MLSPSHRIEKVVEVPVEQCLVGVTQGAFESSHYVRQAFINTVVSFYPSMQGTSPIVSIVGYIPTYRREFVEAALSSVSLRDVPDPTGVKVKYNILFEFAYGKAEYSNATLIASINTTLTVAARSVSGGASPFSTMLITQFLNITGVAGSIETNPFSGVTTAAVTVSPAVVTEITQAPVISPTLAPENVASNLMKKNQIIILAAVSVGSLMIMATSVVIYILIRHQRYKVYIVDLKLPTF